MTIVEIWLASSIVGVLASLYGLRSALLDLSALGPLLNGRKMVAHQRVYSQAARLFAFACWTLLGIAALQAPEPPFDPAGLLLLLPNVVITGIALSDIYVGRALRKQYAEDDDDEEQVGSPPKSEEGSASDEGALGGV